LPPNNEATISSVYPLMLTKGLGTNAKKKNEKKNGRLKGEGKM